MATIAEKQAIEIVNRMLRALKTFGDSLEAATSDGRVDPLESFLLISEGTASIAQIYKMVMRLKDPEMLKAFLDALEKVELTIPEEEGDNGLFS